MSNLGSLVVSLEANLAKFQSDMGKAAAIAEARAREIDRSIGVVKTGLASLGLGFAVGASFEKLKEKIEGAISSAAGLQQLSERTGATVEALSGLASVARLSGTDTESLATGLQKLSKSMIDAQNGGSKTGASFAAIGISVDALVGKRPEQVFQLVSKALAGYQDGAEKVVIAQNLLGKAGANLLPVLKDLADAGDLQVKVTSEQARVADEYEKNLVRLRASSDAIFKKIGLELVPVFNAFTLALLDTQNANNGVRQSVDALAKDGSIREWAEGAARAAAFVIDAFDGVARVVQIVGKGIGATGAAVAAVARGEFAQAAGMQKQYFAEVDAILARETFSSRLKTRLEDAAKAGPAVAVRKKIDTSGLGNANAATGPKDDAAKKLLEGQLKEQEAFIAAEQKQLQTREDYLRHFYELEYSNASDYYATKKNLITDALASQLAAYDKETAAARAYLAQADSQLKRQDALNTLQDIAKKRTAAEIESNKKLTDTVLEQAKAYREFDLATSKIARDHALANQQAQFAIDLMGKGTLEVMKLTEARRLQLALEQRLYEMRSKNLPQAELERAVAESEAQKVTALALVEAAYNRQRDGAFGASEAIRKYTEDASNNAMQIESALTSAFKGAEDALVKFVQTGKLDFKSLVDSIVADIARIVIREQITAPLAGWIGGLLGSVGAGGGVNNPSAFTAPSGGGDFLSSIFSIGKGLMGFAGGGSPPVGVPSIVGERGPELFIPRESGTIIPNGMGAGGAAQAVIVNNNFTITGPIERNTQQQIAARAASGAQRALLRNA